MKLIFLNSLVTGLFMIAGINSASTQSINIPIDSSYNVSKVYQQIHADYPKAVPAKEEFVKHGQVLAEMDIPYAEFRTEKYGMRTLRLDIFMPKKQVMHPAIIMIHGGGWRSGNKTMLAPMAEMLATEGFVAINVEYQLSLEAPYPAAVHNIKSAIRWVKANAKKYNIDTSKIAISGCSAGGQLASLVGLTNGVSAFEGELGVTSESSSVKAIVDIDGVINFLAPWSLNLDRKPNSPDVEWLGGTFVDRPSIWKEASGIFWATKTTTPPILFLNSGYARFHAGQDELIGMMKEWGIYYEVHKFDLQVHPFWLFHPWVDQTVSYIAAFLHKVL